MPNPGQIHGMKRSASILVLGLFLAGCGARTIEDFADELAGDAATTTDTGVVTTDSAVSVDVTPGIDSGPIAVDSGPAGKPIACGMTTCNTATQECCFESEDAPPRCTPKGSCMGPSLSCSSSVSCGPGESCCLDQDVGQAVCKSGCGREEITLCTTNAECPAGTRCRRAGAGLSACIRG